MKQDKYKVEIIKKMGRAILDYNMIEENEKILVAVSGGKDSVSLIDLLYENLKIRVLPIKYSLYVFHLSIVPNQDWEILRNYCEERNIPFYHKDSNLIEFIAKQKKNPCYLCSQIRRKWLFEVANNLKIKKIALGHTLDDIVTTSLMNIFYHRSLASEVPNLEILNGKFTIIRPLAYIEEKVLVNYSKKYRLPVFKSHCTIGDNKRRKYVQNLIENLSKEIPNLKNNIFASFRNPSYNFFLDRDFNPVDHKGKKYRP